MDEEGVVVVGVVGDRTGYDEECCEAIVESFFNFHDALAKSSLAALRRRFDSCVSFLVFVFLVFLFVTTSFPPSPVPFPTTAALFVFSASSSSSLSPLRGPIRLGSIRRGVSVLKVLRRSKEEREDSWVCCSGSCSCGAGKGGDAGGGGGATEGAIRLGASSNAVWVVVVVPLVRFVFLNNSGC